MKINTTGDKITVHAGSISNYTGADCNFKLCRMIVFPLCSINTNINIFIHFVLSVTCFKCYSQILQ